MKKLTVTMLAVTLMGLSAFAQGTVNFANIGGGVNAPVLNNDGSTKASGSFTIELMAGSSAGSLSSVATTGFINGAPGYFNGGVVTFDGSKGVTVAPGANVFLQVDVWSTASGSFANAHSANVANTWAQSGVLTIATGGVGTPQGPPSAMTGLTSMTLNSVPEPSSLALAGLGAAALMVFRRRK